MNAPVEERFVAQTLRKTVLQMAFNGSAVHIGCAFSIIELLAVLYRNHLRYPDNNPKDQNRDYLVLSKGHGVMAQYACMKELGWLTDQDITDYFSDGSRMMGLSDSRLTGLEVTSGSLGHGFSVGVGLALAAKIKKSGQRTYIIVGDGEINEGPIWEGALFASHHQLKDLMLFVDLNGFQAMGATDEVLKLGSVHEKLNSFGFEVMTINGHDEREIDLAICQLLNSTSGRPKAIVAETVKGKGVGFMENDNIWHYTRLNAETYANALDALTGG
ncbi:MAG: transketolase [Magnetococcales bacterium]|nr:transketolase [Magnetococcales bacterium]